MKTKFGVISIFLFLTCTLSAFAARNAPQVERRPYGEISLMGGYSKSTASQTAYTITKHYTGTAALYITRVTQLEVSYSFTDTYFSDEPVQTTRTTEQSLGVSVIQSLVPSDWRIEPYVKGGVAQYNRSQTGTIAGIPTADSSTKSPSGILGAGLKIMVFKSFSVKVEAETYLPNFHIRGAKDNVNVQGGVGWNF